MSDITLHYFDGKARAELARLILAAGDIKYNDVRLSFEEWPSKKPLAPAGQLPYIEFDGIRIPQSIALSRYLAKLAKIAGNDDIEQAKVDAVVDTCNDIMNSYYPGVYRAANVEEAYAKFIEGAAANGFTQLEKLIGLYGQNGYSVGNSLTWADLFIHEVYTQLLKNNETFLSKYPVVEKVCAQVGSNQRIADYIKNRKQTPF
jgi:prostaglandin-H2 D-isomerase / glutathione transferase